MLGLFRLNPSRQQPATICTARNADIRQIIALQTLDSVQCEGKQVDCGITIFKIHVSHKMRNKMRQRKVVINVH